MERAISFGHQAERYDAARPSYPAAAVDWLVELEVTDAPQVMEVGCGTGILTRQLVERSCQGIALDPDPAMLAVARRSGVREFRFECSTFENWSSTHRFDLVVAGQSWHWVDDSAGFPLAHEALRPGGHLVLLWNRPASEGFQFRNEINEIYAQIAPALAHGSSQAFTLGLDERLETLQIPAPFVDVERAVYPWSERRTTEQYLDLLQSHSNHIQLADPTRNRLLKAVGDLVDRHGDTIETRHRTLLIKASREASASSVALTK